MSNKSIFKIIESTQGEMLTIDEIVGRIKISKAKVELYLSNLQKAQLIEKSRDGKYVKVKSKVNLNKLAKHL